jgi:hypothetical protein
MADSEKLASKERRTRLIERLNIEELQLGRLHVRELVVEHEQQPGTS